MQITEDTLVPLEWTDGVPMTVEAWGQREWNNGRKNGQAAGINLAATFVLNLAKEEFAKGKDSEATSLRDLAKKIRGLSFNGDD